VRADYQRVIAEALPGEIPPGERFKHVLTRLVELNQSGQWNNCLLLTRLAQETATQDGAMSEQVLNTIEWLIEFWRQLIVAAQENKTLRGDCDSRQLAELLMATLFGAIGSRELRGDAIHLDTLAEQLHLLMRPI